MRVLASALILVASIQGVLSTVYSCEEIKYKLANQKVSQAGNLACVVFDNSTTSSSVDIIFLRNGDSLLSLRQIANQTYDSNSYGCASAGGISWQVETQGGTTADIDCTAEIALIFSSANPNIYPISSNNGVYRANGQTALVSVYAGMRLENITCGSETQSVTFYTGAGAPTNEMLYPMVTYSCDTLPSTYIAFENVISLKPNGLGSVTFSATTQYKNGLALGVGDRATVASSGKADNLQNTHPSDNYAHFDLSSDATVLATGSMQMDPKYQGSIQLVAQGRFYNKSQSFTDASLNWTFYADSFEVHYLTSVSPQDVWLNTDNFVIEIQLDYLPPNLTTPAPPTTPTRPTSPPVYTTLPTQPSTQQFPTTTTSAFGNPTTTQAVTPSSAPANSTGYCNCDVHTVWLDIVALIDTSAAMSNGKDAALAAVQSALIQLNLSPSPSGKYYSRTAVGAYAQDAQIVRDFSNLTADTMFDIDLPNFGGDVVNITKAIDVAIDVFSRYQDNARINTKQVILIVASAYNDDIYLVAEQFKAGGGVIMIVDFVQPGEKPLPGLQSLASPGYFFVNDENTQINFKDLESAFCDANCFCNKGLTAYTLDDNERKVPNGGCYNPITLAAIQPAAESACKKQKATLSTIHDDGKQFFLMGLYPSKTKYWIGLKKIGGTWTWDDNSTLPYSNLATPTGSGDCAYSMQTTGFKSGWFAAQCFSEAYDYVCQARPCDSSYYCF